MFDAFNEIIVQDKKVAKLGIVFDPILLQIQKNLQKFAILRYTFKVQTVLKTKKKHNCEYFDQNFLMKTRKLKLINIQASAWIIYVKIFN